jgi:hypothetical protein
MAKGLSSADPVTVHCPAASPVCAQENTDGQARSVGTTEWSNPAVRRYVTNADGWCLLALISSVTFREAKALRGLIRNYIEMKPYFGAGVTTGTSQTFEFAFHLPYYTLKACSSPPKDSRTMAGGEPFRKSAPLALLTGTGGSDNTTTDYLAEAQISFVIIGTSPRDWYATCLVDDNWDGPAAEVLSYYEGMREAGLEPDPIMRGSDGSRPILTPREYFIRVLDVRIRQVADEWTNSVSYLQRWTRSYVSGSIQLLIFFFGTIGQANALIGWPPELTLPQADELLASLIKQPGSPSARHAKSTDKQRQEAFNWTTVAKRQLFQVSQMLSGSIQAWDRFLERDRLLFKGIDGPAAGYLESATRTMDEIRVLEKAVNHLQRECREFTNSVGPAF